MGRWRAAVYAGVSHVGKHTPSVLEEMVPNMEGVRMCAETHIPYFLKYKHKESITRWGHKKGVGRGRSKQIKAGPRTQKQHHITYCPHDRCFYREFNLLASSTTSGHMLNQRDIMNYLQITHHFYLACYQYAL